MAAEVAHGLKLSLLIPSVKHLDAGAERPHPVEVLRHCKAIRSDSAEKAMARKIITAGR